RLLSAWERRVGAGRHLAGEVEPAEKAAQLLRPHTRRDARKVPQRRLVIAQHLNLVLCEVTDDEPVIESRGARQRLELACDRLDKRRLARAVDAEEPVALAAREREADVADHHFVGGAL